jgi:hypothetical protein
MEQEYKEFIKVIESTEFSAEPDFNIGEIKDIKEYLKVAFDSS